MIVPNTDVVTDLVLNFHSRTGVNEKEIEKLLQPMVEAGKFRVKKIVVPKEIKNVEDYLVKVPGRLFSKPMLDVREKLIRENTTNKQIPYLTGDIDYVVGLCGHYIIVEEKPCPYSLQYYHGQIASQIALAMLSKQPLLLLMGKPKEEDVDNIGKPTDQKSYKFCFINPVANNKIALFEGNLEKIQNFIREWMEKSVETPSVDCEKAKSLAWDVINSARWGDYKEL